MLSSDNTVISSNKGREFTLTSYKEGESHCHQATAPLSPATRKENSTVTRQHPPMSPATRKENSTLNRQCHRSRTLTGRRFVLQASSTTLFTRTIFPATKRWAAIGTRNQRKAPEAAGSPPPSHSSRNLYTQTPRSPSSGK